MIFLLTVFCLFILIILIIVDFRMGRNDHHESAQLISLEKTTADYRLYRNGPALFEDLFQDISTAKSQVDIYFFIIKDDYISKDFLDLLKNKAQEGIPVRLLCDRLGCFRINKKTRQQLRKAGVEFHFAEKPGFPYLLYKFNKRNHRKITVIDRKVAYVGGFNVGKSYIGDDPKFGDWRDYHLRLVGPVVTDLHGIFLEDWYLETDQKEEPHVISEEQDKQVRVMPTDGVQLEEEFRTFIRSAQKEIFIGTPYFIPTELLLNELKAALKRGVQLKIMVPLKSDHPFVKEAGIPYLTELFRLGADVRLFDAGFYHSKVFIVDESFADIGTANFDRRSFFLNKEVNVYVYDPAFIKDLRHLYLGDAKDSIPFDEEWLRNRSLATRINEQIARLLRPVL